MSQQCAVCNEKAAFGYADAGALTWFCAQHRRAQWSADARCDGSNKHPILDAGPVVPATKTANNGDGPMVSINDRYPKSGLFSAKNWDPEVGDLDLQIDHLELDRWFGDDKPVKDVLHFKNDGRELVLNGITGRQIAKLHGNESDDWAGRWITLYLDPTVEFQGNKGGIRVRDRVPAIGSGNGVAHETASPDGEAGDEAGFRGSRLGNSILVQP
jgi:hypothetical protein